MGQANIQALAETQCDNAGSSGVVPNLLVANIPQLAVSILYTIYKDVLAKIFMAHKFDEFTRKSMGLRVSEERRGAQQGSLFFDLPAH